MTVIQKLWRSTQVAVRRSDSTRAATVTSTPGATVGAPETPLPAISCGG